MSLPPLLQLCKKEFVITTLVVAFVLKALILLVVVPEFSEILSPRFGISFADDYDKLARNLVLGNGYRFERGMAETLMREPGYPLFLAAVFKVLGDSLEAARFANLLLSLGIAAMIAALARRVSSDKAVQVLAILLFLFHPGVVIAETRGGVEILFIFFLMVFFLMLHKAVERQSHRHYFVAGIALGLVLLTRSTPMLFPLFVAVYLLLAARDNRGRVRSIVSIGVLAFSTALMMSPWIIRNYMLIQEFVPTSSVAGVSAQGGQYICEHLSLERGLQELDTYGAVPEREKLAMELGYPFKSDYYQYFYTPKHEVEFSRLLLSKVVNKYSENPSLFAKCVAVNLFNFWFAGKTWQVTSLNVLVQLPFLVLGAMGLYRLWKRGEGKRVALIALFVIYLWAVHAVVFAQARYSIPLVPFLAILASIGFLDSWSGRRQVPKSKSSE